MKLSLCTGRSISNPSSATLSPPVLPRRRQSSNSLRNNNTNPFLPGATPTTRRPVPDIPSTNPNHREFSTSTGNVLDLNIPTMQRVNIEFV